MVELKQYLVGVLVALFLFGCLKLYLKWEARKATSYFKNKETKRGSSK